MYLKFLEIIWYSGATPALGRLREEDHEFQLSLGYIMRPYHKKSGGLNI